MKRHNERKHNGVLRIKNASFGVGGKWSRWNVLSQPQVEEMSSEAQEDMVVDPQPANQLEGEMNPQEPGMSISGTNVNG